MNSTRFIAKYKVNKQCEFRFLISCGNPGVAREHKATDFTCPTTWPSREEHKVYMAGATADTELFTHRESIREFYES